MCVEPLPSSSLQSEQQSLCLPREMLFPALLLRATIQNSVNRWKLWICLPVMPSRGQTAPRGDPATGTKGAGALQPLHWDLRESFSLASVFTFHRFYGRGCALQQPFFFFFPPGIHSRCRIVEDTCRNKPSSRGKKFPTLPILLSPTEVKAILLIIGCIKSLYKHRSPSRNPAVRFSSATHPKAFRAGKLQGYHVFPGIVLKVIDKQLSHCLEHP